MKTPNKAQYVHIAKLSADLIKTYNDIEWGDSEGHYHASRNDFHKALELLESSLEDIGDHKTKEKTQEEPIDIIYLTDIITGMIGNCITESQHPKNKYSYDFIKAWSSKILDCVIRNIK
jgi:hypothetical protein